MISVLLAANKILFIPALHNLLLEKISPLEIKYSLNFFALHMK